MSREIKLVQDMIAAEGRVNERGQVEVPADLFTRINAALNPPRRSFLEDLLNDFNQETALTGREG